MGKRKGINGEQIEFDRLRNRYKSQPDSLSNEERGQLLELLSGKQEGRGLTSMEDQMIKNLTGPVTINRRKAIGLLAGGVTAAGMAFFSIGKCEENDIKVEPITPEKKLQKKTPERLAGRAEVERLAELTDRQIELLRKKMEEWRPLLNERDGMVRNEEVKLILAETFGFLFHQLKQNDNNNWRQYLKEPKFTDEHLKMAISGPVTGEFIASGTRINRPDHYKRVNFMFTDDKRALGRMATYFGVNATIYSPYLLDYSPRQAALIILHEAYHAKSYAERHDALDREAGRKLDVKEHYNLDLQLRNHDPHHLKEELTAYAIEAEMANILSNNALRQITDSGRDITTEDFVSVFFADLPHGRNIQLDSGATDKFTALLNLYFKHGEKPNEHPEGMRKIMDLLSAIYHPQQTTY